MTLTPMVVEMVKVKICGVKDTSSIDLLDGVVDYIGMVSSRRGGPRSVSPMEADMLASTISRSTPVLVMHGYSVEEVLEASSRLGYIRTLQLHPTPPPEALEGLIPALESLGFTTAPATLWNGSWTPLDPCTLQGMRVEYVLADRVKGGPPLPPRVARVVAECHPRMGIAGGLNPERICMLQARPYLVDASSWPEEGPGVKDPWKVLKLVESVRRCM